LTPVKSIVYDCITIPELTTGSTLWALFPVPSFAVFFAPEKRNDIKDKKKLAIERLLDVFIIGSFGRKK